MGEAIKSVANTPSVAAPADWDTLHASYTNLQKTAYATQGVKTSQVTELQAQFEAFIKANVDDATKQKSMLDAIKTDLGAMATATEAKEKSGKTSNAEWDTAREDLEALLSELAPEGADAVWTPKAAAAGAASNVLAEKSKVGDAKGADAAAGSFGGISMVSLDAMVAAFPELKPYREAFISAGAKHNVPPQLLAAQAMQESHANTDPKAAPNMMQFKPGTWDQMNTGIAYADLSMQNAPQQIEAAAKYDAELLGQYGGDMARALDHYSGGVPAYLSGITKWMNGRDGYMS